MSPEVALALPLDRFPVGETGRIVSIVPREPGQLVRLASFGLVPGACVKLEQLRPAAVLRIGETTLALDIAIAAGIFVAALDAPSPA